MPRSQAFRPDWTSAPGDTIGDILRERAISVEYFAAQVGQSRKQAEDLLLGKLSITIALARRLERVLGGSVEFWMSREFRHHQRVTEPGATGNVWLSELPLADMVSFGWLKPAPKPSEALASCLKFFGVPSIAAWYRTYGSLEEKFSFRTSPSFASRPASVAVWLRQGELEAQKISCAPWTAKGFSDSLLFIRSLTKEREPKSFVPKLQRLCAESGVAVAIVRCPDGCRASGATRFLGKDKALLLLSFRYLSDDQFWFSFFHEAGHLLLHSHKAFFLEGIEAVDSKAETEANEFAFRTLIPPEYLPELYRAHKSSFEIGRFARRVGISPGIVVGQLQHFGRIKRNHYNHLRRRYRWDER